MFSSLDGMSSKDLTATYELLVVSLNISNLFRKVIIAALKR